MHPTTSPIDHKPPSGRRAGCWIASFVLMLLVPTDWTFYWKDWCRVSQSTFWNLFPGSWREVRSRPGGAQACSLTTDPLGDVGKLLVGQLWEHR